MGRIQDAETGLVDRLAELRTLADEVAAQQKEWQAHHERVMALLALPERAPEAA
jgi:hypothetical protein